MTLIHCSIFCRCLYKVPYIFYALHFITGFALNGTTAGVQQPEVVWPRSPACLCALNTASISSKMAYCMRDIHRRIYSKRYNILSFFFLRIRFFCFKTHYEMKESKVHFQHECPYSSCIKSIVINDQVFFHCVWCPPVHIPCQVPSLHQKEV